MQGEYASRGSGQYQGGARRTLPPKTQDDGCPKAGDFVCHSGVDFWAIGADGCPKAGDFICHLSVDFSTIEADGCPKAGDFVCHSSVDFSTIKADGCPEPGTLFATRVWTFSFVVVGSSTGGPPELRTTSLSAVGMWLRGVLLQCFLCVSSKSEVLTGGRCRSILGGFVAWVASGRRPGTLGDVVHVPVAVVHGPIGRTLFNT